MIKEDLKQEWKYFSQDASILWDRNLSLGNNILGLIASLMITTPSWLLGFFLAGTGHYRRQRKHQ